MEDLLTGDLRPVRRAPPPPSSRPLGPNPRNEDLLVIEGDDDPFSTGTKHSTQNGLSRPSANRTSHLSRSASLPLTNGMAKKVPPPRPPPPKNRHSQKKQQQQQQQQQDGWGYSRGVTNQAMQQRSGVTGSSTVGSRVTEASLIDLSSPPASPATRSGSDGLSVNSLGSESSGNHSCGVDDFDPFAPFQDLGAPPMKVGSSAFFCTAQPTTVPTPSSQDSQDPFDLLARRATANTQQTPQPASTAQPSPHPTAAPYITMNSSSSSSSSSKEKSSVRATIIRPKAPVTSSQIGVAGDSTITGQMADLVSIDWSAASRANTAQQRQQQQSGASWDAIIDQTIPEEPPPLPPRPDSEDEETDRPYGIAEFEFASAQTEDLGFKVGDVIQLLYRVNDDWLFGRCGPREGIFPQSFIKIVVPLAGEKLPRVSSSMSIPASLANTTPAPHPTTTTTSRSPSSFVVTALYTFQAETPDDLTIHEGNSVRVIGRINEQWLMGEREGHTGQFPANFIDRIPPNLPQV